MSKHDHIDKPQIDSRVFDLLNRGIDGELSQSEQAELNRILAGSEQARNLNAELAEITGLLDQLPERDPPHYLQSAIERRISLPLQDTSHRGKPAFLATWWNAHRLRTGIALAAGLVLTISVYEMGSLPPTDVDTSKMAGTMAKDPTSNQGELLSSIHLNTDTLSGRVELRNNDNLFSLDIQLNSDIPAQLVVNFADRGLEYAGVTPGQDFVEAISVANGSIKVASNGEQHFTLKLKRISEVPQAAPLELNFFTENKLVEEVSLSISGRQD